MSYKLNLEIIEPSNIFAGNRQASVNVTPFRIGRDKDNDWVIDDRSRLISRHHCIIEFINNVYTLTDISSNGVYLNEAQKPLGRGNSTVINDGDVISLSGTKIRASQTHGAAKERLDAFLNLLPPREGQNHRESNLADSFAKERDLDLRSMASPTPIESFFRNDADAALQIPDFDYDPMRDQSGADYNFDRTPAEFTRFVSNAPIIHSLPEDWNIETQLDLEESRVLVPSNRTEALSGQQEHLLNLLLVQFARIEKAVIEDDENSVLTSDPTETMQKLAEMDKKMVEYVIKNICAQALTKIENNSLKDLLKYRNNE